MALNSFGATSVKRHSITWTFDTNYETGTFVNGDPWVKENTLGAGITIVSKSPNPTTSGRPKHGTMINVDANEGQGYDDAAPRYRSYLNAFGESGEKLPYKVSANSSVISTEGVEPGDDRPAIKDAAILTVLPANVTPSLNDFRPPYSGADKSLKWSSDDILWERLPNLTPPNAGANTPTIAAQTERIDGTWLFHEHTGNARGIHPKAHMPEYGRDLSIRLQTAMLRTLLNDSPAQKRELVVQAIQRGIDIYGDLKTGMSYPANGGHNQGMKMPLLYAGWLLNDPEILWWGNRENYYDFQEDESTFYVSQTEVNYTQNNPSWGPDDRYWSTAPYTQSDIGMPEWGIRHKDKPDMDNNVWATSYRTVSGDATVGHALVAKLMGLEEAWNHPPFFDYYTTRYYSKVVKGRDSFLGNMWDTYGGYVPPVETRVSRPQALPVSGTYETNDGITVSISTSTAGATIRYTIDGSTPNSSSPIYSTPFTISASATVKAIAYKEGLESSEIEQETYTITSAANTVGVPSISPNGGGFFSSEGLLVSMASNTSGATIYYTTDGSMPTRSSTQYVNSFRLFDTTTIKAIAIKDGFDDSAIATAEFTASNYISGSSWQNISINSLTNLSTTDITLSPLSNNIDSVTGISSGNATNYNDLAIILRFNANGLIDVRNGTSYTADVSVPYEANKNYQFRINIDISKGMYDVYVTPQNSSQLKIADNYAFRTGTSSTSNLNNIGFVSIGNGGHAILDFNQTPVSDSVPTAPSNLRKPTASQ